MASLVSSLKSAYGALLSVSISIGGGIFCDIFEDFSRGLMFGGVGKGVVFPSGPDVSICVCI